MAAVNHFHIEQLTACTHTGDNNWSRGDDPFLPQIAAASLTADTNYLIIAQGMLASDDGNKEVAWRISTADDTTIATKSNRQIEPSINIVTNVGYPIFYVGSFKTHVTTPTDIDMELRCATDSGDNVWVDQALLVVIDLDDLGSGNYVETLHSDDSTAYPTTQAVEWTIPGSSLGTDEWLVLACQGSDMGSATKLHRVEFWGADDGSVSVELGRDMNEAEDSSEIRPHGFVGRHKASSGTPDFECQIWGVTDNGVDCEGGYGIAIKTSAFESGGISFDFTSAATDIDSTESTVATISSYSPTTTADHIFFASYNVDLMTEAFQYFVHIEDDGAEMRTGDAAMGHRVVFDPAGGARVPVMHLDNILSSNTSTYTARAVTSDATADGAENRWLVIWSMELAGGGGAGSASPAVIARSFTVDAVTQTGPGNITPAVTARSFTVDAVTLLGQTSVRPAVIARNFTVDAPTLTGPGNITPATIARLFTVDAVTVSGSGNLTPAAIARLFTMDAVSLTGPGNVSPGAIARLFTVDAVTTDGGGGAGDASPAAIIRAFTVDAVNLTGPGNITPAAIVRVFTVDLVTLLGQTTVRPATIARAFTVDAVTVSGPGNVTPGTIVRVFILPAVTTSDSGAPAVPAFRLFIQDPGVW